MPIIRSGFYSLRGIIHGVKGRSSILFFSLFLGCGGGSDAPDGGGTPDAAPPDAAAADADLGRYLSAEPLYSDFAAGTVSPDALEYEPAHPLWSDGAEKRRWIMVPAGTLIDT